MEYLKGYTVKPDRVTSLGEVLFTDGTNKNLMTNQITCEAYGYTYDRDSGTCTAFRYTTQLERNISNINNKFNGTGNSTELGSNNIQMNGRNNTTKGFNNNCFISGSDNEIANGVSDATVLGSNGTAIRAGEFVISSGGGQSSTVFLSGSTTDASATALFVSGDAAVTTIARLADTIYIYTIDIIAHRTGGASGSGAAGDRAFFKVQGIVRNNVADEGTTTIAANGTVVGWTSATAYVGDDMKLKVTGAVGMNIDWQATANFQELKQ